MQVMCALFTAVCAVFSQLTIPIQPVPITLGSFAALMAGGFLGKRYGFLSLVIYLLLGMAGVPSLKTFVRIIHDARRRFRHCGTIRRIHRRLCSHGIHRRPCR